MKVFSDGVEALKISYKKMNPFCIPLSITNMGSAMLATDLGWMGPNYSISSACATSNFCILNAANHVLKGEADMMLCGGSDAVIIPSGLGGFVACGALSRRNSDPTKALRPWDSALANSGVSKEDMNYINANATSTPSGDLEEYRALIHCFGKNQELKVKSTKSMIGNLLGASGAVEAVATVQAIQSGWIHPNLNLENPDEGVASPLLRLNEQWITVLYSILLSSGDP